MKNDIQLTNLNVFIISSQFEKLETTKLSSTRFSDELYGNVAGKLLVIFDAKFLETTCAWSKDYDFQFKSKHNLLGLLKKSTNIDDKKIKQALTHIFNNRKLLIN